MLLAETFNLSAEMAFVGHFCAHSPQAVQEEFALGIMPAPAFLYGLLPGMEGVEDVPEAAFLRI